MKQKGKEGGLDNTETISASVPPPFSRKQHFHRGSLHTAVHAGRESGKEAAQLCTEVPQSKRVAHCCFWPMTRARPPLLAGEPSEENMRFALPPPSPAAHPRSSPLARRVGLHGNERSPSTFCCLSVQGRRLFTGRGSGHQAHERQGMSEFAKRTPVTRFLPASAALVLDWRYGVRAATVTVLGLHRSAARSSWCRSVVSSLTVAVICTRID